MNINNDLWPFLGELWPYLSELDEQTTYRGDNDDSYEYEGHMLGPELDLDKVKRHSKNGKLSLSGCGWAVKSTRLKLWCFCTAECGFKSQSWHGVVCRATKCTGHMLRCVWSWAWVMVLMLVSLSKTLNNSYSVLCPVISPVFWVMHGYKCIVYHPRPNLKSSSNGLRFNIPISLSSSSDRSWCRLLTKFVDCQFIWRVNTIIYTFPAPQHNLNNYRYLLPPNKNNNLRNTNKLCPIRCRTNRYKNSTIPSLTALLNSYIFLLLLLVLVMELESKLLFFCQLYIIF